MESFDKNNVIFDVCRTLLTDKDGKGIEDCFKMLGETLELDGCFNLLAGDIPFMYEIKNLWLNENNRCEIRNGMLLDLNEDSDEFFVESYIKNLNAKHYICNDITDSEHKGFIHETIIKSGIRSFVVCSIVNGNDSIGDMMFFCRRERMWTDEEVQLIREAGEYISRKINDRRLEETYNYLVQEAEKTLNSTKEATGRFVSNLSHEIRTPINALVGMISIMRHNMESIDVIGECLDRMERSSKQLMDTVNDCIDMTLINNNEVSLNNSWFTMTSLADSVYQIIKPLATYRGMNFDFDYDEGLSLFGDELKLRRILSNAIINSCNLSENGTNIMMTVKKENSGNHDVVTFRIRDEVIGIDEETAKHIFDPFAANGNREQMGNGLAMTVTKQLVEIVHGTIEFFSDGWGTELVIQVPFETRGGKKEKTEVENVETVDADIAEMYIGRRILIAEDNVLMGEILATILGYRGLETDMALDGKEALEKFTSHEPFYYDMILMDIQMPVMDGLEATQKIRACGHADAGLIPIAALSANAFDEDVQRALDCGMNVYLRKPVSEKELFAAISNLVM